MNQRHSPSHLFTLRLWQEDLGADQNDWRGRLKHVLSGDTHHFRDWSTLVDSLLAMLETHAAEEAEGLATES